MGGAYHRCAILLLGKLCGHEAAGTVTRFYIALGLQHFVRGLNRRTGDTQRLAERAAGRQLGTRRQIPGENGLLKCAEQVAILRNAGTGLEKRQKELGGTLSHRRVGPKSFKKWIST